MKAKRCSNCLKGHPKYFRILPLETKLCPNCGGKLESVEIDLTPEWLKEWEKEQGDG